ASLCSWHGGASPRSRSAGTGDLPPPRRPPHRGARRRHSLDRRVRGAARAPRRDQLGLPLFRVLHRALHPLLDVLRPARVHGERRRADRAHLLRGPAFLVRRHPARRRAPGASGHQLRGADADGPAAVLEPAWRARAAVPPDRTPGWPRLNVSLLAVALVASGAACTRRTGEYVVHRSNGPIAIDGVLAEAAWDRAERAGPFVRSLDGKPCTVQTVARLLWDDDNLYLAFQAEDPDISTPFTGDGGARDPVREPDRHASAAPPAWRHLAFQPVQAAPGAGSARRGPGVLATHGRRLPRLGPLRHPSIRRLTHGPLRAGEGPYAR